MSKNHRLYWLRVRKKLGCYCYC